MSDKPSSNEQLDAIKRGAGELVADLRSRGLLLPAVVLLVAIVAAMIVLPSKSEPPAPSAAPVPSAPTRTVANTAPTIEITLITPSAIGDSGALDSSRNPFLGRDDYTCKTITNGDENNPRVLECEIGGIQTRVICPLEANEAPCGSSQSAAGGASGSTGEAPASGGDGTGATTGTGGGDTVKVFTYEVTVVYDGKTYKNIEVGDPIPSKDKKVVTFAGVNETATRAAFMAESGSTVTGVTVDKTGLQFAMKKGQTATITDPSAESHKLKLTKIAKVEV